MYERGYQQFGGIIMPQKGEKLKTLQNTFFGCLKEKSGEVYASRAAVITVTCTPHQN